MKIPVQKFIGYIKVFFEKEKRKTSYLELEHGGAAPHDGCDGGQHPPALPAPPMHANAGDTASRTATNTLMFRRYSSEKDGDE